MRQRRIEALQRCAKRAMEMGLPVACAANPFASDKPEVRKPSVAAVLDVAAQVTGVSVAEMRSHRRAAHISVARQFACWLLWGALGIPYTAIERAVNKTGNMGREGISRTNRRLAEDWPVVVGWRNKAADLLSRLDPAVVAEEEALSLAQRRQIALRAKCPPLPPMRDRQRRLYLKLRRAGVDRSTALKTAGQPEHTVDAR